MLRKVTRRSVLAMAAAVVLAVPASVRGQEIPDRSYLLATATTGGTYYPVGVALATLTKVKLQPTDKISMSAITSAGSGENIKLLGEDEAQFAILQGLYGAWAWNGTGKVAAEGPQKELRSVTMLWQDVEHFVVDSQFAKTGNVSDLENLKGKKFSIGKRNSGTEGSGRTILTGLGIAPDTFFDLVYMGYNPSADALQNGTISGMNMPAGPPVAAITRVAAAMEGKIRILDFNDDQMAQANKAAGLDLWTRYTIPANTYPGQAKEVRTMAQSNFLAVREPTP